MTFPYLSANLIPASGEFVHDAAPRVHAPVNFHVHALDAQGVASFLQGNGREIMKAVDRRVQDGLHLGVRGLNPT